MDIMEDVRIALRKRIIDSNIATIGINYQLEGNSPPSDYGDYYIRETLIEYSKKEVTQLDINTVFLAQYDIFVPNKIQISVTSIASSVVEKFTSEFNVKYKDGVNLYIEDGKSIASIQKVVRDSARNVDGFYMQSVLVYIDVFTRGY